MTKTYSLMIHGGAGVLDRIENGDETAPWLDSIQAVLERGRGILEQGGSALDVVELCATLLEDNPLFNAGRGSVLNENGKVETDAAIMDGRRLACGAVAAVSGIANPIQLARLVLSESKHVLLAAEGASQFAKQQGIRTVDEEYFLTDKRLREYQAARATNNYQETANSHDTIGAVARDTAGNLAAATSTGGMTYKHPGRIGDSPLPGAGLYADNATCAVSATGHGEDIMRSVLAKYIADLIEFRHANAGTAVTRAMDYLARKLNGKGGVIVIDTAGNCASGCTTRTMIRGWIERGGPARYTY